MTSDTILVGYDNAHGDDMAVLIIGRKRPNDSVEIINAFQGEEANALYKKLITDAPKGKVIPDGQC